MSNFQKITEHVYWLPPAKPDRPSLCAVVGSQHTLMLDAGASPAHTQQFLDQLTAAGVRPPCYVALTHWHWDHIFGAACLPCPIIAHRETAAQMAMLASYEWTDAALDERVQSGVEIEACARDIKLELPAPRQVQIALPDVIFEERLTINLGDVTCQIQHVGGDHATDACVIYVEEDRLLFLGDCLYEAIYTPVRHYTGTKLFPLVDRVLAFDAQHYIEGHTETVMSRAEIETMIGKMRLVGTLVEQFGTDEAAIRAAIDQPIDDDLEYFIRALMAGKSR